MEIVFVIEQREWRNQLKQLNPLNSSLNWQTVADKVRGTIIDQVHQIYPCR